MTILSMLLDKVKESDREGFRKKVESMEAEKRAANKAAGLNDIEDIFEKELVQLTSMGGKIAEDPTAVSTEASKPTKEVFDKFIKEITG
jgi:hypothetical protein